jgi:molecular chaperone IbpA
MEKTMNITYTTTPLLDQMMHGLTINQPSNYPPHNIIQQSDDKFTIQFAIAGMDDSNIDITVDDGMLSVSYNPSEVDKKVNYVHRGIANRPFTRKFKLAPYTSVTSATNKNGILNIELLRELPEAMKPKKITITSQT